MNRVLIVYESLATPTTTVRALQFENCFEKDSSLHATFIGRTSERMNAIMQRWPWRPSLRRPAIWAETKVIQKREDQIVELAKSHDTVMLVTVPSWRLHQRLCDLPNTKVVTDLIDAVWLPAFQSAGWQHIHQMLQTSDAVICENEFTARYTRSHNSNVAIVPDSPQIEVFDRYRDSIKRDRNQTTIGWIGGKYTADALYRIFEPLEKVFAESSNLRLLLLGADPDRLPRFEHFQPSVIPSYNQTSMVQNALAMDIGIFPMFKVDESLYRGALKSRIYMAAGCAVVGQKLGDNELLIEHDCNGRLAASDQDWIDSLRLLIADRQSRERIATAGLEKVRTEYSRDRCYDRLREVLLNVN
ncbi:glycosyltransferase [Stieleria sp. JC731]|uniref:glycosyltransferase family protein n=1 Tax=Pirellulaceae TaxID=2691357 RepID=UPI001E638656|nr:glycosyltransferase [Stieleria sp. JC731]MCC9601168.1 glycosyltransferase [Stieleria sp. JC731]